MTDNVEEQCELEGCTRPRCEEDCRKHNYCCKEHAENDGESDPVEFPNCLTETSLHLYCDSEFCT